MPDNSASLRFSFGQHNQCSKTASVTRSHQQKQCVHASNQFQIGQRATLERRLARNLSCIYVSTYELTWPLAGLGFPIWELHVCRGKACADGGRSCQLPAAVAVSRAPRLARSRAPLQTRACPLKLRGATRMHRARSDGSFRAQSSTSIPKMRARLRLLKCRRRRITSGVRLHASHP